MSNLRYLDQQRCLSIVRENQLAGGSIIVWRLPAIAALTRKATQHVPSWLHPPELTMFG